MPNHLDWNDYFDNDREAGTESEEPSCTDEDYAVCGECIECSTYCDVCGTWYYKDDPCGFH